MLHEQYTGFNRIDFFYIFIELCFDFSEFLFPSLIQRENDDLTFNQFPYLPSFLIQKSYSRFQNISGKYFVKYFENDKKILIIMYYIYRRIKGVEGDAKCLTLKPYPWQKKLALETL